MSNITVDDNSSLLSVGTGNDAGVLFNKDKTRLIFFPSKVDLSTRRYQYKLPNSVKEIGGAAFSGYYPGLKSLVLPTNLELIDTCAFMTYQNTYLPLDELTIPAKAHIKIGSLPGYITKLYLMGKENLEEVRAGHAGLSFSVAGVNSTGYGGCPTTTVYVKPSMLEYYKPLEGYYSDGKIARVTDRISHSLNYHLTTLCYDFDVDLTDAALANGAEAYIATEAKEGNFTDMDGNADKGNYMVMKKVDYLPSRTGDNHDQYTGVLIKGTAGSTISFKMGENDVYSSTQTLLADDNMLVGVPCYMYLNPKENNDGSEGTDYVNYGLGDTDFQRYLNPGVIGVHKAYLRLPSGQSLKAKLNMMFVNPQTTSISSILDNGKGDVDRSEMWYDLQGRQISHPSVPGIYIKNGKKIVIRHCRNFQ